MHAAHIPIILQKLKGSAGSFQDAEAVIRPRRILVVDDNRDGVSSLSMILNIAGHETRSAYDGLEAIQVAAEFLPHIVLLDLGLPKLDGYEVCRRLREQVKNRSMVVVAVTGRGQDEDRQKSLEAGFDMHLVKPVEADMLMVVLASAS